MRRVLTQFSPDQILADPDCGLKTRTVEEAKAKLKAVRMGVDLVKEQLGVA